MKCFRCDDSVLGAVVLDVGLAGRGCGACGGVHVDLLAYRVWLEERGAVVDVGSAPGALEIEAEEGGGALVCGRCSKLMVRYKIAAGHGNYVDVCVGCDGVWLDQGEWELLESLALEGRLTEVVTSPWQKGVRRDEVRLSDRARDVAVFGKGGMERLEAFVRWAEGAGLRQEVIHYLRRRD